jgi:hypothetical protein
LILISGISEISSEAYRRVEGPLADRKIRRCLFTKRVRRKKFGGCSTSRGSLYCKGSVSMPHRIPTSRTGIPCGSRGAPGNATLLTIRFGEFNEFRYDHRGSPALHLTPRGECRGRVMSLTVQLMVIDKRLRIVCNGATAEVVLPSTYSSLQSSGAVRFGQSAGITSLEGKYPPQENFPGSVVETGRRALQDARLTGTGNYNRPIGSLRIGINGLVGFVRCS